MSLTHSQRAMIYLVAKQLTNQDFCAFMSVKPQRASQMVNWRKSTHKWSAPNRQRAIDATGGGLDVCAEAWTKIERLLDAMPRPSVTAETKLNQQGSE